MSNPCFELWLILHFQDCTAFLDTAQAERKSRALDGRKGKRIQASTYLPKMFDAVQRAEKLEERHAADGTVFPDDNPSSSMFRFLQTVKAI
jgi:hypothetical protein